MPSAYLLRAHETPSRIVTLARCPPSSRQRRLPRWSRRPPLQSFHKHRQLRRRQCDRALLGAGPGESAFLQPLGKQAEALAVPVKNLDEIAPTAAKAEECTRERVLLQHILRHDAQAVEAAPHVGNAARQIDAYAGRDRDHRAPPSSAATSRAKAAGSIHSSTLMMRPLVNSISMRPTRRCSRAVRAVLVGGAAQR